MGARVPEPKSFILSVRVTPREAAVLARQAKKAELPVSEYLRRRLLLEARR